MQTKSKLPIKDFLYKELSKLFPATHTYECCNFTYSGIDAKQNSACPICVESFFIQDEGVQAKYVYNSKRDLWENEWAETSKAKTYNDVVDLHLLVQDNKGTIQHKRGLVWELQEIHDIICNLLERLYITPKSNHWRLNTYFGQAEISYLKEVDYAQEYATEKTLLDISKHEDKFDSLEYDVTILNNNRRL